MKTHNAEFSTLLLLLHGGWWGRGRPNVTYLTYIIFFTFLCNLAEARACAFPSYFI